MTDHRTPPKYKTLKALMESPDHLSSTAYLDNDTTGIYDNETGEVRLLELHPRVLLEQALELLNINHEEA